MRNTVGMPMLTTIRAIMRPRRFRSSMIRVAIMAPLGTHEPRWSCAAPSDAGGSGIRARGGGHGRGGHSGSPNRVVTSRNQDSSEAWISWRR